MIMALSLRARRVIQNGFGDATAAKDFADRVDTNGGVLSLRTRRALGILFQSPGVADGIVYTFTLILFSGSGFTAAQLAPYRRRLELAFQDKKTVTDIFAELA
jgi:hypothetical protein